MKLTLMFLGIFIALVANQSLVEDTSEDEIAFRSYKAKHSKQYKDKNEEKERKKAYIKCRKFVKDHNEKYKNGEATFSVAENKHCDLFDSEIKSLSTGNKEPPFDFSNFVVRGKAIGVVNSTMFPPAPPSFSWTGSNCLTPVKDQGYYCNNCWAFSGIAALEAHWCIKNGELISLSEQQLIDCNRNSQTGSWGCDGGD